MLVLDLSRAVPGPHAAIMLGDLGARAIKDRKSVDGDDTRRVGRKFECGLAPSSVARSTSWSRYGLLDNEHSARAEPPDRDDRIGLLT
jgi:crotonobetainyl-CoA:carnitine CoA-transferase CaiB-like acyl-CoA transferase